MNGETKANTNDDLVALTEAYCNGTLDNDDLARLEGLLLHDRAARSYFRRYMALDAALHEHGASSALHWSPPIKGLPITPSSSDSAESKSDTSSKHATNAANPVRTSSSVELESRPLHSKRGLQIASLTGLTLACAAVVLAVIFNQRDSSAIGTLEDVTGDVRVISADGKGRSLKEHMRTEVGDTVRTIGSESSTVIAYPDGTRLTLVGSTSATCGDHRSKSLTIHEGTLAATVSAQSAEKPVLLTTPLAQLQLIGTTRCQIAAADGRIDLVVREGRVRVVRIRDQASVEVPSGKHATVTDRNEPAVKGLPDLASVWEETFEAGLPEGWVRGEWITASLTLSKQTGTGLPTGSRGGVKAKYGASNREGSINYSIDSHNAWLQGLFAVHKDSHLHFTFKTESRKLINIVIVTRTAGSDARFAGSYLLDDFPKRGSGQWETISIPLANFKRIQPGTESLMDVVPFKLMFVSDKPDRGLVIDRIWVTPDGPGRIVSELLQ